MARLCPPGRFRRALDRLEWDFETALEELEGLARTYAKDPDVRAALGAAYLDDERPFEALPHLEWAERKDPTPTVQDALLSTYLALDMPQHALRLAARSGRVPRVLGVDDEARPEPDALAVETLSRQDRLAFERGRTGLLHGDPEAPAVMVRLLAKHPGYMPARNLLVTNELLLGNVERYVEAAGDAFALAPGDPHALLNAVRAAFLRGGLDATCALRPHVEALEADADWGGDRYLARAGALALMDDAHATEAALGAYHGWVQTSKDDAQSDLADAIDDLLERRKRDPRAPLVDLAELVVGLARRWAAGGPEGVQENVEATFGAMPGLLGVLPDWIGYQTPGTVRRLALPLLLPDVPPPGSGSWVTVFERVARHGPGTPEARHALLHVLTEAGLVVDDETVDLDAEADDLEDDDVELAEVPDLTELAALPMREERWCIALRPAVFMIGEDPETRLTWVGSVATDDGFVRFASVEPGPFDVDAVFALFAQACAGGMVAAEPSRPHLLSVEDADLATRLAERLAELAIGVEQGDVAPALAAVHGLAEALAGRGPTWLADAEEEHVEDFFDASIAFYDATPWRRFPSDRFLAFRVGDGPWRYANVMGQAGQEFGLAVYAGWREANAYLEDPGDDEDDVAERLAANGWLEGLSLTELGALSPLDAARYLMDDIEPDLDGQVPAWLRFEPDGPARPEHGPGVYAVLIDLLAEEARRARSRVRRIDVIASTPAGRMRVVYPATGEEVGLEVGTRRVVD